MRTTRRYGFRMAVLLGTGLAIPVGSTAEAQPLEERRLLLGFSGGVQFVKDAIRHEVDFELFQEGGHFTASYDFTTDTAIDGSIAVRFFKRMAAGVDVSHFNKLTTAAIDAEVPHPFFFSFPRTTTGLASGVTRRELAVHLQAQYWHVIGDDLLVRGFFGPTVFDVSHDLVANIITEERGFDFREVDLVGHTPVKADTSELGFNIGLDVSFFGMRKWGIFGRSSLIDRVGLAAVLRYSRGTAAVEIAGQSQQAIELGGTHLAGGLRVVF